MSIEHVTIDDLKTLAKNLRAEGQNSRAQMVEQVIKQMTETKNALRLMMFHFAPDVFEDESLWHPAVVRAVKAGRKALEDAK